ncbi:MAG: thiamine phosphate synthase [Chlamydiae bacterium]|nr:thiamine phosphate synthase [Chlamydiota bacterium]MBI3267162.1 thiamine phosphate synthase [Chlamydiota bacterium]
MKINLAEVSLYVILDTGYLPPQKMLDAAKKVIFGGCRLIQLRDKELPKNKLAPLASAIKKVLPDDAIFILNDFVDLVKEVGADGVHLGQEDMSVSEARRILGSQALIGLSTHSPSQALASMNETVNYIGYGPIYKTKTKPMATPIGVKDISFIKSRVTHPLFAIGGFDEHCIEEALCAGANGITVVSAILESENIEEKVRRFLTQITGIKNHEKLKV